MAETLFIVLILGLGSAASLGFFGAFLQTRLLMRGGDTARQERFRRGFIVLVAGEIVRSLILLERIIENQGVTPSVWAWAFIFGLTLAGIGFVLLMNVSIEEMAERDIADAEESAETRHQKAEAGRVDAEVGRMAGEEYRERGEEHRETGEDYREAGEMRRESKENWGE